MTASNPSSKLSSPHHISPMDTVDSLGDSSESRGGISGVSKRMSYDFSDTVSRVSVIRQYELYTSSQLNEASDLFTLNAEHAMEEEDEYWTRVLNNFHTKVIQEDTIGELEEHITEGIPGALRGKIYLKFMQVRYRFNTKENFAGLLRRARAHNDSFLDRLALEHKDSLRVFNYYVNEIMSTRVELSEDNPPNTFIIQVSKMLDSVPGLSEEEAFFLLLKFNKLFSALIKDEFFYKLNRALEELAHVIFEHVVLQGVSLINFYKKILFGFFDDCVADAVKVLDFVVFEGFDFVLRFIVWVFQAQEEKIMALGGDELSDFMNSKDFWAVDYDWKAILRLAPSIIKYENEYHLINIDSLNSNELRVLKEANYDLNLKISDIKKQLSNLGTIHSEIVEQNDAITVQVQAEEEKRDALSKERDEYQAKYENLTLKENLKNTIKANKEFSVRNKELEDQIEELKKGIEGKKKKLGHAT